MSYKFLSEKNILVYPEKGNICSVDKEFKGPESFVSSRGLWLHTDRIWQCVTCIQVVCPNAGIYLMLQITHLFGMNSLVINVHVTFFMLLCNVFYRYTLYWLFRFVSLNLINVFKFCIQVPCVTVLDLLSTYVTRVN